MSIVVSASLQVDPQAPVCADKVFLTLIVEKCGLNLKNPCLLLNFFLHFFRTDVYNVH
jgi:hypothetical protein